MRRTRLFASVLVCVLGLTSTIAYATDLTSAAGQRFDIQDGLPPAFSTSGAMSDGTGDAYDSCYSLNVGDFFYNGGTPATLSLDGRQTDLPAANSGAGFTVERHVYVPATGPSYARYIDVIRSTSETPITTTVTISGNLGSDGSTVLVATSSGDMAIGPEDSWFATDDSDASGDPSLAHVFQGPGGLVTATSIASTGGGSDNVSYSYPVEIPAGGVIAIMHFAVQERDRATATATAAYIAELPEDVLNGADEYLPDVVNWAVGSSGVCSGTPEGAACTSTRGDSGICHNDRCCTGCWDGAVCRSGRSTSACATGGAACVVCASVAFCESATCEGGVCAGSPCDDGETCTTDSCDEAANRCDHAVTSGCIVGGECVTEGAHHVAYPCLVCDSSRNASDWSPVDSGATCGADRCNLGRLFQGGTCDGMGECVAPSVELCDTLSCSDTTTCEEPCTETSCGPGERCGESRLCEPLRGMGDTCTIDAQCMIGTCVDGVCCESTCEGTCESCVLPGTEGICTAVPSGTDPYEECSGARVCSARECVVPGTDAATSDAGTTDASTVDAAVRPDAGGESEGRGCSCMAIGAGSQTSAASLSLLAIGLVLVARRRKR